MQKLISICACIICVTFAMPILADEDCDLTLKEAKTAYNAGKYTEAKKLYDYVSSICGPSYGNASAWSRKCQDAMTPRLSVSRSNISVNANSGTTSVSVTSNRTWKLTNTSSSLFTVNRNGDNITISYSANPNTTSRSDYFDIVTTDGSKSARVRVTQEAKVVTSPYLTLSKYSVSTTSSGTTEYITVSSNTTWEIQYPSGTMYDVSRSGNTLTVRINENTSSESRTDYFNVKTTDGNIVKKVSLSQKSSTYADITDITVDHNVYQDGLKGMRIHVKFDVYNAYQHKVKVCVFFYFKNGDALKGVSGSDYITNDGCATVQSGLSTASYTNSTWSDFKLFMPYNYLNMASGCKDVSLEGRVGIKDKTTDKWLTEENKKFYFTFSN